MKLSSTLTAEQKHVEQSLADSVICRDCKCTLATFADLCSAGLSDDCPGFQAIESAKAGFRAKEKGMSKLDRQAARVTVKEGLRLAMDRIEAQRSDISEKDALIASQAAEIAELKGQIEHPGFVNVPCSVCGEYSIPLTEGNMIFCDSCERRDDDDEAQGSELQDALANTGQQIVSKLLIGPDGSCRLCGFLDSQAGHERHCPELKGFQSQIAEIAGLKADLAIANEAAQFYNRKAADAIVLRNSDRDSQAALIQSMREALSATVCHACAYRFGFEGSRRRDCALCKKQRAALAQVGASPLPETRNSLALGSFTAYCKSNPSERFWQALRNWSKFAFIVGLADREKPANYADTFNIEGLDGTRSASPLPTVAESLSVPPEALCVCGQESMYHPVSGCEAFSPKLSASPQAQEPTP